MDHDQLKQLLPLGALDRLENQEARAMAAHLAEGCDECEAELRSLREALAAMAISVAGEGPAERIWQRLERRLEGEKTSGLAEYRRTPGLPAERARERAAETEPHRGVSRRWRTATGLASAAAIMLAVLAVNFAKRISTVQQQDSIRLTALETQARDLSRQLADRDRQVVTLREELAMTGQLTRAVLAPDLRTVKLGPLPPAPDAAGLVAMSESNKHAVLQVAGLPQPPRDKEYELWWIGSKSGPVRAAVFSPGPHGGATVACALPPSGERLLAGAITLEPAGGVDKPTGAMYLKGAP